MQTAILFISFFVLLLLAVPIGYSIGIATLLALVFGGDSSIPLIMVAQNEYWISLIRSWASLSAGSVW